MTSHELQSLNAELQKQLDGMHEFTSDKKLEKKLFHAKAQLKEAWTRVSSQERVHVPSLRPAFIGIAQPFHPSASKDPNLINYK